MPKRSAKSQRACAAEIISIAQQASPKVSGQRLDRRAQLSSESTVVVMTFFSKRFSSTVASGGRRSPVEGRRSGCGPVTFDLRLSTFDPLDPFQPALAPGVDVADEQDHDEGDHLQQPVEAELVERDGPGVEEDRLDVEDHEEDGDDVEAGRVARP